VGTPLKAKHIYEFGSFRLDTEEKVLMRQGQAVPIPPKDLETLLVLVEQAGHIVQKDELMERVWPGVFIEEGNLSRRVFNLRQVLGDSPDGRKYIETIPRRGYRFIAAVHENAESEGTLQIASQASERPQTAVGRGQKKSVWLWSIALTVVLAMAVTLAGRHSWRSRNAPSEKIMLAVLPFVNLSADAREEYFVDGFTEEMIAQLGQLQPANLGVIARTSAMRYKNTKESVAQIGQELGVHYLLEGSVRQAGERVRITAQLIQANDQTHLWAESYETPLTDILNIQREIAERITQSLRLELLPAQKSSISEAHFDPEEYRKYLLGLNEFRKGTREGLQHAIQDFQNAIAIDPQDAHAYAALAEVYSGSAPYYSSPAVSGPLAKQAALKALELDPNLASAHVTLGDVHLLFDWDWTGAEANYQHALAINPSSPEAQLGYSNYLSTLGRHDEAVSHARQAYLVNPLALESRKEALWVYYFSGRLQETVEQAQKTIEFEPQAGLPYALLALAYADLGRRPEALRAAEQAAEFAEDSPSVFATTASAVARAGQPARAKQLLEHALDLSSTRYVCRFIVAGVYADLGETERAFDSLELAFRQRST
jgi:TolB-like protein/DNA-binding winged helix-turn-helix (wHTH) protein/Tfp pilus assembly protein PilF